MQISVIIPVYNAEKYLPMAIESVINQTFKDIEIILVNDGSTDSSQQIIERYAAMDDRIVVLNKQNEGVSKARAAGVAISRGKYIQTMDNDDYMYPNALEKLYTKAIECDADMVVGLSTFYIEQRDEYQEDSRVSFDQISGMELFSLICHDKARWATWTRMHKASIYRDQEILISPLVNRAEDVYLTAQLCYHAKKVVSIDDIIIKWNIRETSLSNNQHMSQRENLEFINLPLIIEDFFVSKGLRERTAKEILMLKVYFDQQRMLHGCINNAYQRCRYIDNKLESCVELKEILSPRMQKIIATFRKYSYFGYLRLWKYKLIERFKYVRAICSGV